MTETMMATCVSAALESELKDFFREQPSKRKEDLECCRTLGSVKEQ